MDEFESVNLDGSDVLFSLHQFDPPSSPVYDSSSSNGLDGAQVIQRVLASPRIGNAVSEIARKQGRTVNEVFSQVKEILDDIGHTLSLKSIRFMGYILRKVFRNIYSGIKVNVAGLKQVQELSKQFPVVLVPSHRSYTDFLLVSFVCYIFQLPLPAIAAAQDFKNMTIIGSLLRSCGAFYMKRSFRSDELYWMVFFEYVQCLMLNSGTTIEFFLEGTRSRAGKSLLPKQGLLSILTDLYFTSRVPDVMFVPVSISYERVLEERLLARELLGVPKPKESLRGLLNSHTVLLDDHGFAYLYFGKPVSLRKFSDGEVSRLKNTCVPRSIRSNPSKSDMVIVRKLASHILARIQDHLVILPNMIIAAILLQNPVGINVDGQDSKNAVIESLLLLKSLLTIDKDDNVCLIDPDYYSEEFKHGVCNLLAKECVCKKNEGEIDYGENTSCTNEWIRGRHGTESCDKEAQRNEEGSSECKLSLLKTDDRDYLIHLTCIHLQLAHQRNQLLHWFYIPAMMAVTKGRENYISQDQLYSNAKFTGDLVAIEVARDEFLSKEEFFSHLEHFKELGIFELKDGLYNIKNTEILEFILGLWRPLITAYWIVYCYINECCVAGKEYVVDTLIHHCQEFALSMFLKGIVRYLEVQSLELLKNGLKSLVKLHIIRQLKFGSEKRITITDKTALYNLVVTLGSYLQLPYVHPVSTASKL